MVGRRRTGLVAARKAVGFTQERLAEEAGVQRETVVRWEDGQHAPSPYMRPKLARILGRTVRELETLIDPPVQVAALQTPITSDIEVACDWLDKHAGWRQGAAYQSLISDLEGSKVSKIRERDGYRGAISRGEIATALDNYYRMEDVPWYQAEYEGAKVRLAITAHRDWLDLDFVLTRETDLFKLANYMPEETLHLDAASANIALRRLLEAVVLNVTIVNSPLYRLVELSVEPERVTGSVSTIPFVQYALTTDLLEMELADRLIAASGRSSTDQPGMPMRDRYLPTISSVFDVSRRQCSGGALALCAIARPADRYRGPEDYVLLTQERGRRVLNGVGRISVIPRGFHQPLTDFRTDAPIGSTLRRELEEELFRRDDVDNTISDGRVADPMHPNRLSEPMRWLMQDPGRVRFESTGFGFNLVNGNYEYACLIVIDDPEFWVRYGDQIEANWESVGLRQYSTKDPQGIGDLVQDKAWSSEGLFALLQGLRRLNQLDDERVELPEINVDIVNHGL